MRFFKTAMGVAMLLASLPALAQDYEATNYTRVQQSLGELLRSGYLVSVTYVVAKRNRFVLQKGASTIHCTLYLPDNYSKTGNVNTKKGVDARSRCISLTD